MNDKVKIMMNEFLKDLKSESKELTIMDNLLEAGYHVLISTDKVIVPEHMKRKSSTYEYIKVMLNEKEEDFKIIHLKTIRATSFYSEWSIEDARNNLKNDHPILNIIEKLNSFKKLNNDLSDENKSTKRPKV